MWGFSICLTGYHEGPGGMMTRDYVFGPMLSHPDELVRILEKI